MPQWIRVVVASSLTAGCGSGDEAQVDSAEDTASSSVPTTGTSGPNSGAASDDVTGAESGGPHGAGPVVFDVGGVSDVASGPCFDCSPDLHEVRSCDSGAVVETCTGDEACDATAGTCRNACEVASDLKRSVGCTYAPVFMELSEVAGALPDTSCFAVFVANTWDTAAHLTVERDGEILPIEAFAGIPEGTGATLGYSPYDAVAGLEPGAGVVLFLSGPTGSPEPGFAPCPMPAAIPTDVMRYGTGIGTAFRLSSDVPVVAYEMNPFGGGNAARTGASLLLPTSAWDSNYVLATSGAGQDSVGESSVVIVADEDDTHITIEPTVAVDGGGGIPASAPGEAFEFTLDAGEYAQINQMHDISGSILESTRPVGVLGGSTCQFVPAGVFFCDHMEQMIPPVRALGDRHVGVMHRPRWGEPAIWRIVGAVDGTQLTWSSDVGGPGSLERGEVIEFVTGDPFEVASQGVDHPFLLFSYMGSSSWSAGGGTDEGYGDADFVLSVPTAQYMQRYVFFTDPSYPENNLVVVRAPTASGFAEVELDCLGILDGWSSVGEFEWTRVDLTTGDFADVGACSTGRREMQSDGPFGVWVWGWGTPLTDPEVFTRNVSYAYPAGMNVRAINGLEIPAG